MLSNPPYTISVGSVRAESLLYNSAPMHPLILPSHTHSLSHLVCTVCTAVGAQVLTNDRYIPSFTAHSLTSEPARSLAAAGMDSSRTAKGYLAAWLAKHPVAVNDDLQQYASSSMVSDGASSDSVGYQQFLKDRLKSRFRRSGSKLLSLLGIRSSCNGECLPSLADYH